MNEPENWLAAAGETPETAPTGQLASLRTRIGLFALLAIGFGVVDLIYYPLMFFVGSGPLFVFNAAISAAIGVQIDLIALWTALGPGRMIVRLPTACLALMGSYVLLNTGRMLRWGLETLQELEAMTAANLVLGWLAATMAIFTFRSVTRLRLAYGDNPVSSSSTFHLHHLVIGTAIAGVTLALFNVYGSPGGAENLLNVIYISRWCIVLFLNQAILLFAIAAAFLWSGSWGRRLLKLLGIGVAISIANVMVFLAFDGLRGPSIFILHPLLAGVSHCMGLMVVLSLIRGLGYELRVVDSVASAVPKAPIVAADPWSEEEAEAR
ncbi:hypothetical protein LOC68_22700 [Blastopirellula sp. JC732]|uniref:Uncharacterized protein n=1 Tax=Blastopirellula sediminis TaxID=2894196 RepID=A0A9X1SIF7_9BACT|nr:hypothetical protein [Blastopirellula sediminis]MCC9605488.1 hypothetical protein [Blastopirellula sediminis]MCC9631212.1 hypothetical protein [Blastopirellula sediminis]